MVSKSQSPWRGPFIDESVLAKTANHHRAYRRRFWRSDTCCISEYRSQRLFSGSANSTSGQSALKSYQFQNVL